MTVALSAAERGFFVFPLWPRSKVPALHGEDACPRDGSCAHGHRGWEDRATRDPDVIRYWWHDLPLNIGVAAGRSGLHVVDLDAAHGVAPPPEWAGARHGRDVLARLAVQAGEPYPGETRTVRTPSGGYHLYYLSPPAVELRNTVARVGWRVDSRGHGGYVVAAGSIRSDGRYQLINDHPIVPLPAWLVPLLTPPPIPPRLATTSGATQPVTEERKDSYLRAVHNSVAAAEPGTRHHHLLRAAYTLGRLVQGGDLDEHEARTCLHSAAARWVGAPSRKDLRTIRDGLRAGAHHPRRLAG